MQKPEQIEGVELKFICNENWDKMHPVEGGRHCDVCNKKVVDFTNKDQNDFTRAWQEAEGKLCGRFKAKQTVHLPQFRFDRAAAVLAAGSALLLSTTTLSAQKTMGKMAAPVVKGEPAVIQVQDSAKRIKPPVICNKPVKGQWETMVLLGDTIAPIKPPIDTVPDTSSSIINIPNMDMLGGPMRIDNNPIVDTPKVEIDTLEMPLMGVLVTPEVPTVPEDLIDDGEIIMGKPSPIEPVDPEPIDGTDGMNDFIDANIRWPEKLGHNLTVFVQVRIDKEGNVFNAYMIRGYRQDVDSEAMRVARLIEFNPARNNNGEAVESVLTIPINFTYRQR
ncbi:MAG: energy transducer TonB [Sphingobacteriales bacterium JAD_PAG50586_3]|nr:MAG: energy transducer TonB [Sphingobacteriales bacterium JAD_PAG50586_3]